MVGYVQHFNNGKTMSFNVSHNRLLRKYNEILKKSQ